MLELIEQPDGLPSFYFFQPLEKAGVKEEGGRRLIEGVAATPDRDEQGETVLMKGLDLAYLFDFGKINWHHRNNPEDIIGEPVDGDVTDKRFFFKGELYAGQPRADAAWRLLQATKGRKKPALGWSVEGRVLERDRRDPTRVLRARVNNIALTPNPVNATTYADLCKAFTGGGFAKSLDTAAGSMLIPQSLEGGVQTPESDALRRHFHSPDACVDEAGNFVYGYPGALAHFADCLGAELQEADGLARVHRQIAEQFRMQRR